MVQSSNSWCSQICRFCFSLLYIRSASCHALHRNRFYWYSKYKVRTSIEVYGRQVRVQSFSTSCFLDIFGDTTVIRNPNYSTSSCTLTQYHIREAASYTSYVVSVLDINCSGANFSEIRDFISGNEEKMKSCILAVCLIGDKLSWFLQECNFLNIRRDLWCQRKPAACVVPHASERWPTGIQRCKGNSFSLTKSWKIPKIVFHMEFSMSIGCSNTGRGNISVSWHNLFPKEAKFAFKASWTYVKFPSSPLINRNWRLHCSSFWAIDPSPVVSSASQVPSVTTSTPDPLSLAPSASGLRAGGSLVQKDRMLIPHGGYGDVVLGDIGSDTYEDAKEKQERWTDQKAGAGKKKRTGRSSVSGSWPWAKLFAGGGCRGREASVDPSYTSNDRDKCQFMWTAFTLFYLDMLLDDWISKLFFVYVSRGCERNDTVWSATLYPNMCKFSRFTRQIRNRPLETTMNCVAFYFPSPKGSWAHQNVSFQASEFASELFQRSGVISY